MKMPLRYIPARSLSQSPLPSILLNNARYLSSGSPVLASHSNILRDAENTLHSPLKLHYILERAPAAATQRAPLLLVHGLLGSSTNYRSLLPRLQTELHRDVYALDLRNHGRSPHSPVMTYKSMVDDLDHFFTEHNINNPILLGHSLGGKVAKAVGTNLFVLLDGGLDKKV